MKNRFPFLLVLFAVLPAASLAEWKLALPGWSYEFPRDHHYHPGFKTEWWYFTGNLRATHGEQEFGYQLTFFRQGIRQEPPDSVRSRFEVLDLPFAHFAVSDLSGKKYHSFSSWSRGAFGEAGFSKGNIIAWIEDWSVELAPEGGFLLEASEPGVAISLRLTPEKPPVFHGENGVSQKAEGEGRASHYYSFTRLNTTGSVVVDGKEFSVSGTSWYDHEWATNQLTEDQEGWDWFSLQFDDGTELMLFQIRRKDGTRDPFSGGTWVAKDGATVSVKDGDFELDPVRFWKSPETGANYPVEWKIRIPKIELDLQVEARLEKQEFSHPPISYWEGSIRATGSRSAGPIAGKGYLEMTGYAGPIVGMQAPELPQEPPK